LSHILHLKAGRPGDIPDLHEILALEELDGGIQYRQIPAKPGVFHVFPIMIVILAGIPCPSA
jgi:hypothetical protein